MTWTLGEGSACAAQTNFVALITAQLAAPSAPLAIRLVGTAAVNWVALT
jgi:hypothetical protein